MSGAVLAANTGVVPHGARFPCNADLSSGAGARAAALLQQSPGPLDKLSRNDDRESGSGGNGSRPIKKQFYPRASGAFPQPVPNHPYLREQKSAEGPKRKKRGQPVRHPSEDYEKRQYNDLIRKNELAATPGKRRGQEIVLCRQPAHTRKIGETGPCRVGKDDKMLARET